MMEALIPKGAQFHQKITIRLKKMVLPLFQYKVSPPESPEGGLIYETDGDVRCLA